MFAPMLEKENYWSRHDNRHVSRDIYSYCDRITKFEIAEIYFTHIVYPDATSFSISHFETKILSFSAKVFGAHLNKFKHCSMMRQTRYFVCLRVMIPLQEVIVVTIGR